MAENGIGSTTDLPVAGLGVDIVEVERVARACERSARFTQRVFTEGERAYCEAHGHPERHYAARFAAKEAVAKALGTGFRGFGPQDVEVVLNEKGRPGIELHGGAAAVAAEAGIIAVHVSLSHTSGMAVANAVAVTEETLPHRDKGETPQEKLFKAFKEARTLLDELDAHQRGGEAGQGAPAAEENATDPLPFD